MFVLEFIKLYKNSIVIALDIKGNHQYTLWCRGRDLVKSETGKEEKGKKERAKKE